MHVFIVVAIVAADVDRAVCLSPSPIRFLDEEQLNKLYFLLEFHYHAVKNVRGEHRMRSVLESWNNNPHGYHSSFS